MTGRAWLIVAILLLGLVMFGAWIYSQLEQEERCCRHDDRGRCAEFHNKGGQEGHGRHREGYQQQPQMEETPARSLFSLQASPPISFACRGGSPGLAWLACPRAEVPRS